MQVLVRSRKGADTGYPITADAADMWSAGVLLFAVAAKRPPFTSTDGSMRDPVKTAQRLGESMVLSGCHEADT